MRRAHVQKKQGERCTWLRAALLTDAKNNRTRNGGENADRLDLILCSHSARSVHHHTHRHLTAQTRNMSLYGTIEHHKNAEQDAPTRQTNIAAPEPMNMRSILQNPSQESRGVLQTGERQPEYGITPHVHHVAHPQVPVHMRSQALSVSESIYQQQQHTQMHPRSVAPTHACAPIAIHQMHPSSSQSGPAAVPENAQVEEGQNSLTPKKRGTNITPKEDAGIVRAWISTSEDPVKGADQRGEVFNEAVATVYNWKFKPAGFPDRNIESIRKRAAVIKRYCVKFSGHVARVQKSNPTGVNYNDILKLASALWNRKVVTSVNDNCGPTFRCIEAWEVSKNSPKFMSNGSDANIRQVDEKKKPRR